MNTAAKSRRAKIQHEPYVDAEFPVRLRRLRVEQGWSLRELANLTGGKVSDRTLGAWERGEARPNLGEQIRVVAQIFRISPGQLLRGQRGEAHAHHRDDGRER